MSDDDDWDSAPVTLTIKKPVVFDEDEEAVELEEVTASKETTKPKNVVDEKTALTKAKAASKQVQKEREEELAREAERARNAKPMTAEEKAAEALRLKKLVEESDMELTKDLFSGVKGSVSTSAAATGFAAKAKDGVQDLDSLSAMLHLVKLDTGKQATELASAVSKKLELGSKKISVQFLKDLLRGSCVSLNDDEVNELIGVLNVIKNEKVKAKLAKKKPTAPVVKPKLNTLGLDKPGGDRFDMDGVDDRGKRGGMSAYDDDDFM